MRCSNCGKYLTFYSIHNKEISCPKCNSVVKCYKKPHKNTILHEICAVLVAIVISFFDFTTALILAIIIVFYILWDRARVECRVIEPGTKLEKST